MGEALHRLEPPQLSDEGGEFRYEPPHLVELGSVHELTLTGQRCFLGKKWGGTDGFEFMGINIPVSSC